MRIKLLVFFIGMLPLFAGCNTDLIPVSPPAEYIQSLQWSPDGSSIFALREKPFDSAGTLYWNNFVEQYNYQGALISSVKIKMSADPNWTIYGFAADCQHLIVANRMGICIAIGDSTQAVVQSNAIFESASSSGNIIASDSSFSSVRGVSGLDGWYQLSWVGNGNLRVIQHWKTHVQMFPGLTLLSDKFFSFEEYLNGSNQFSIYDTNLNLLYRMPDPSGDARGISYIPSINAVIAALHTSGPNMTVVLIDLKSDSVRTIFDQSIIGVAPDGFHIAYLRDYTTLTIRNLLTNAEKDIGSDWSQGVVFSPDASYLAYAVGSPPQVKSIAVNGLP